MEYVINRTYNRSKPEVEFHSTFSSIIAFLSAWEYMNGRNCYSATHHGVAKINSMLVAPRLLYTVMPITKF